MSSGKSQGKKTETGTIVWKVREAISFRFTHLSFIGTCYQLVAMAHCCLLPSRSETSTLKNGITCSTLHVICDFCCIKGKLIYGLVFLVLEIKEQHDFNSKISSETSSLGNSRLMKPFFAPLKLIYYQRVSFRKGNMVYISLSLCLF